jgi:L-Ala-D/L-Glu epimerase
LQFKHPFGLSTGSRTHTPAVFVELEESGCCGYGEAALPPYLPETQESVKDFLARLDPDALSVHNGLSGPLTYLENCATGNKTAKAAVNIALHDLYGRLIGKNLSEIWQMPAESPLCTYTLGISSPALLKDKIKEGDSFSLYKLKLGTDNDRHLIEAFTGETDKPFCVDINQGWKDKHMALDMICWLHEKGALLVEQPLPKNMHEEMGWITERSPIPTIADESFQGMEDFPAVDGIFSGINIKLMKCGGLSEGKSIAEQARKKGLRILIGCMSESSCGVTAAAHLTPYADWADLDGPYLISNDPFEGMKVINGRVHIDRKLPGTGIRKRPGFW